LTGGTGHIGFATLIEALRKGYKVRAAIRRESSIAEIKATKSVQPYLDNLSFIIVPDITADGAFDEALKDVEKVIHIASPLARPSEDYEADIIQPAIRGTLSILTSALKYPGIKRVVITSSQGAVMPEMTPDADGEKIYAGMSMSHHFTLPNNSASLMRPLPLLQLFL
jgi:nucleoside-diphosphate-sugar epimerase